MLAMSSAHRPHLYTTMTRPKILRKASPKPRKIDERMEDKLAQARMAWANGSFKNVKAVAAFYQVPYKTLLNRLKGIESKKKAHDTQALLTPAEKEVLVEWIQYLGLAGMPVNRKTIRPKVKAILKEKGRSINENMVSGSWIRRFLKEFPDALKTSRGSGLDPKRAKAFNYPSVHAYFNTLKDFLKENNIPWENVYNMDEKGVQLGGGRKNSQTRYFFSKLDAMMYRQKSDSLQLVTVVDCVCADGTAEIPPCFVFPGQGRFDEWSQVNDDIL